MELLSEKLGFVAARLGDRVAIVQGERRVSYRELWRDIEAAAQWWRDAGLRPGERVAVILPNCVEAVVAMYSVWRAGGVIVPMNAQAKSREYAHWLAHCEARFLVHQSGNREIEPSLGSLKPRPRLIVVGGDAPGGGESGWDAVIRPQAVSPSAAAPASSTLAMILYTSGTTGRPKGVMLSHGNLANHVASVVQYLGLASGDSVVSVLPFYYSYGNSVLHTHLAVGATLVLEQNLVFPHAVVETMARERVTGFSGVPSTYALLLSRVSLDRYDLSGLRYLTQAGGAMSPALTQRVVDAFPHARLFVMYGQTEATSRLTYLPPERLREKLGSVGIAIPGIEIRVLDDDRRAVPAGENGDVWVRGAPVMLGYWRDADATQGVLSDGWLKTGDMGHLDQDGYLYLVGRRSDMIKTGAHRVHPKDIEEVLAEVPSVAESAVVGIDDELLGQVVKAYVVSADGHPPDIDAIRAHCRERLAAYKVPKHIEIVPSLPKTASGKVRRAELSGRSS